MPKINYPKTATNKAEASNAALIRLIWGAKAQHGLTDDDLGRLMGGRSRAYVAEVVRSFRAAIEAQAAGTLLLVRTMACKTSVGENRPDISIKSHLRRRHRPGKRHP